MHKIHILPNFEWFSYARVPMQECTLHFSSFRWDNERDGYMEGGNVANGASNCFISNVFFKLGIINAAFFSLITKRAMMFVFRPTKPFCVSLYKQQMFMSPK